MTWIQAKGGGRIRSIRCLFEGVFEVYSADWNKQLEVIPAKVGNGLM
jgi:hypothetical protein